MSIIGIIVVGILVPIGIIMGWDHWSDPGLLAWAKLILLALTVAGVGSLTMRYELTGAANKPMQPPPR